MTLFFVFIDGVGLSNDRLDSNPVYANPHSFLDGIFSSTDWEIRGEEFHTDQADLYRLDATLGVSGLPQSATGQAVLLTGINIPKMIGEHFGPKPDARISPFLVSGGILGQFFQAGKNVALVNAYPETYFKGIESGKRLYSTFPLAVTNAGYRLFNESDLLDGIALSADITGEAWGNFFNAPNIPILEPRDAGIKLAQTHRLTDLVIFEFWLTDYAGHKKDHSTAATLISHLDQFLSGIYSAMLPTDLILITSDHGNMEDLMTRHHTINPVPLILIGSENARKKFSGAKSLLDVAPGIESVVLGR